MALSRIRKYLLVQYLEIGLKNDSVPELLFLVRVEARPKLIPQFDMVGKDRPSVIHLVGQRDTSIGRTPATEMPQG